MKTMRRSRLKMRYGVVSREHLELLSSPNPCAICRRVAMLVVDHDHDSDGVRGFICARCNNALGFFGDNLEVLKCAVAYLEDYQTNGPLATKQEIPPWSPRPEILKRLAGMLEPRTPYGAPWQSGAGPKTTKV